MAELELSALARQCLNRRIPDQTTLATEVAAWVAARNAEAVTASWHFTQDEPASACRGSIPIPHRHLHPV